jgi:hypothetical protein
MLGTDTNVDLESATKTFIGFLIEVRKQERRTDRVKCPKRLSLNSAQKTFEHTRSCEYGRYDTSIIVPVHWATNAQIRPKWNSIWR